MQRADKPHAAQPTFAQAGEGMGADVVQCKTPSRLWQSTSSRPCSSQATIVPGRLASDIANSNVGALINPRGGPGSV